MVTVVTGFASIYADLGFSSALIQKTDAEEKHFSSIFWLNLGGGALLTVLVMAAAPLIAEFYGRSILVPIAVVLSVKFLIGSLNIVQRTLLTKALNFRTLAIADSFAVLAAGSVAVLMAAGGYGVWSLVVQQLVLTAVVALLLWRLSDWKPRFLFDWSAIRELLGFSVNLLGTQSLNYWARNLDDLLIGKTLGSQPLGAYNRAYSLMLFPLVNVSRVIGRVMFPSYSLLKDDPHKVRSIHLRVTSVIALITFPLMLGLLVLAEPFVFGVLGEQWASMIPILRILALAGLSQSIMTLNGSLYLSQGRADLQFRVGLFLKGTIITGIVIGLQWGEVGVAAGYAVAALINTYPAFHYAGSLVSLSYGQLIRNLAPIFGCAAAMAGGVFVFGWILPPEWGPMARLGVLVPAGIFLYLAMVLAFRIDAYLDLRRLLLQRLNA